MDNNRSSIAPGGKHANSSKGKMTDIGLKYEGKENGTKRPSMGLYIAVALLAISWNTIDHVKNLLWESFLDYFGDDGGTLWVYGTFILVCGTYWIVGGLFTLMDITNRPKALRKYKVQPGTNEPVEWRRLFKVIWQVNINLFLVTWVFVWMSSFLMIWRKSPSPREPTYMLSGTIQVLFCAACEETVLYYTHRLMHSKYLYIYIHKQHHEWTAPIAVTAIYCSITEHIFANIIPLYCGVVILGTHILVAWVWFVIAIIFTLAVHSGYHFPFLPSPEYHDYHHHNFTSCFGFTGFMDKLHGTDTPFRKSLLYERHILLTSTTSARELYPDKEKKYTKNS